MIIWPGGGAFDRGCDNSVTIVLMRVKWIFRVVQFQCDCSDGEGTIIITHITVEQRWAKNHQIRPICTWWIYILSDITSLQQHCLPFPNHLSRVARCIIFLSRGCLSYRTVSLSLCVTHVDCKFWYSGAHIICAKAKNHHIQHVTTYDIFIFWATSLLCNNTLICLFRILLTTLDVLYYCHAAVFHGGMFVIHCV